MTTLLRYSNKLPGADAEKDDDAIKRIMFKSFPDDQQISHNRSGRKVRNQTMTQILQFMKDDKNYKGNQDRKKFLLETRNMVKVLMGSSVKGLRDQPWVLLGSCLTQGLLQLISLGSKCVAQLSTNVTIRLFWEALGVYPKKFALPAFIDAIYLLIHIFIKLHRSPCEA